MIKLSNNLILIRHAENINNDKLENSLLPLSPKGVLQAKKASKYLINKYDVIISSPSLRTIMTSKIINNGIEPLKDKRLLERGWGNKKQDGKETDDQAKIRIKKFLIETLKKYENKKILLVTHGSLMKLAQDVIEDETKERDSIDNCTIIEYNSDKEKNVIR